MTTQPPEVAVTQADRKAAAAYYREQFGHGTKMEPRLREGQHDKQPLVQAFARHRIAERERAQAGTVAFLAKAAHAIAWQAGVGGRETAGAIISYLATSPDEIAPFFADKLSPVDFAGDWMRGGCLSWHGADGRVWTPEQAAAAWAAKEADDVE